MSSLKKKFIKITVSFFVLIVLLILAFIGLVYFDYFTKQTIEIKVNNKAIIQDDKLLVNISSNRSLRTIIDPEVSSYIKCLADDKKSDMNRFAYNPPFEREHWYYSFDKSREIVDSPINGNYYYDIELMDGKKENLKSDKLLCRAFVLSIGFQDKVSNVFEVEY